MGRITRTNFGCTVDVRLTNVQILLLGDDPITILPARANTIWLPLFLAIISDTTAAAYATVANFYLGVTGHLQLWGSISLSDSALDSGAASFAFTGDNVIGGSVVNGPITDANNLPLVISANANPTGGDPANSVLVRVFFIEAPALSA